MTYKQKLEWLNRRYRLEGERQSLKEACDRFDSFEGRQAQKRKRRLIRQENKIASISCEIINAINTMPDTIDRQILTYRFVNCLKYCRIMERMGYADNSSVVRRVKLAIERLDI